MPRKRQINKIRTDYLENRLAHYIALKNWEAAEAIRWIVRDIGAPIDDEWIKENALERRKVYFEKGDK